MFSKECLQGVYHRIFKIELVKCRVEARIFRRSKIYPRVVSLGINVTLRYEDKLRRTGEGDGVDCHIKFAQKVRVPIAIYRGFELDNFRKRKINTAQMLKHLPLKY